jgi:TRAP-type C4-dicarboxylate transport system substrate-binding protein
MQRIERTSSIRTVRPGRALAGVLAGAMLLAGTGCSAVSGSKTGGRADPVVLTLADGYSDPSYEPAVAYFIKRVRELSNGRLRIQDKEGWGDHAPDAEQRIVRDVAAGRADLGWVGTRVFDTLGVPTFRPLTAPMLIDSYPLEDAVITSPIPAKMLASLGELHVTGLAVLGDGLRKPIAEHRALVGPADWRGVTVQVMRSETATDALSALGATVTDDMSGKVPFGGAERNLRIWRNNYLTNYPHVTANVNLWPQTLALLASPTRLASLPEDQRDAVKQAAKEAAASSTALFDHDQDILTASCARGARFATADAAQLTALRRAFDRVYAKLETDARTRELLDAIRALKQRTPAGPALEVPSDCELGSGGGATSDPLQGVWQSAPVTEGRIVQAFVAAGGAEAEGHAFFAQFGGGATKTVTFRLDFEHGSLEQYEAADGGTFQHGDHRAYRVSGSTLTFSAPGCTATYRVHVDQQHLRLTPVKECPGGDAPYAETIYGSFSFTRQR